MAIETRAGYKKNNNKPKPHIGTLWIRNKNKWSSYKGALIHKSLFNGSCYILTYKSLFGMEGYYMHLLTKENKLVLANPYLLGYKSIDHAKSSDPWRFDNQQMHHLHKQAIFTY